MSVPPPSTDTLALYHRVNRVSLVYLKLERRVCVHGFPVIDNEQELRDSVLSADLSPHPLALFVNEI